MKYLEFLQVNYDSSYRMLSMHVSVVYTMLQPTEQTRVSSAPIVHQLFKEIFRRNPLTRVWAETWGIQKVNDFLHSWDKLAALSYTKLTLKIVMILALAIDERPLDLNLIHVGL